MSKRETTGRYFLIIKKLRQSKYASFNEIADYLKFESEIQEYNFNISERTFQRDINDIKSLYGIYIEYDKFKKAYHIDPEFKTEIDNRLFEAYDVYNALKIKEQNKKYMYFEKRQACGTEHLFALLNAIKKRLQLTFSYQKYYNDSAEERNVNPLVLKEFKYRWYLIARDRADNRIKTYALDRMSNLKNLKIKFPEDTDFDMEKIQKYCFGIIFPENEEPQKIILSFEPFQGKYIKSLPLHETQKILIDNDRELRISLNIYPTYDFKMEILSMGETVKVLEPSCFAQEIKETYKTALKNL